MEEWRQPGEIIEDTVAGKRAQGRCNMTQTEEVMDRISRLARFV